MPSLPFAAEKALIERCRAHEPDAWQQFHECFAPLLVGTLTFRLRRYTRDANVVEELVAEVEAAFWAQPG